VACADPKEEVQRQVVFEFELSRESMRNMLRYSVQPGYQQQPLKPSRLEPSVGVLNAILEDDKNRPSKQRIRQSGSSTVFDGEHV
jgi:hypothetical protein